VDDGGDRMSNKIRKAQVQKIPYMLIAGDNEAQAEQVAVRLSTGKDLGPMPVKEFIARIKEIISKKETVG
jgi:threonyl-tRNA synthetase